MFYLGAFVVQVATIALSITSLVQPTWSVQLTPNLRNPALTTDSRLAG